VYFIEWNVAEVVRRQAPAKPQLEATDAEIRATYKTVGADSRVPDLVFDHVEFADRECVESAKGAPRSAMCSPSAVAFAPGLRGCRTEREQVSLRACRLPHTHDHRLRAGSKDKRARSSTSVLVGALAVKKALFLNVRWERRVGALSGKMFCDINETLNSF
jgi:hypothetical protein